MKEEESYCMLSLEWYPAKLEALKKACDCKVGRFVQRVIYEEDKVHCKELWADPSVSVLLYLGCR